MYETAALWMHERGLKFYASSLQSEEAEFAWRRFAERGLVVVDEKKTTHYSEPRQRMFLDAVKLMAESPELKLGLG